MKDILIGILGLNVNATEQNIIAEVHKHVIDLRGKMGHMSASLVEKLIRDGYLKRDEMRQSYVGQISFEEMERIRRKNPGV